VFSRLKQLAGEALVYGVSGIFSRFLNFFLVPIYTRVFTPEDYGVIGMISAISGVISMFVTLGLDSAAIRYYYDTDQVEDRQATIATWILFHLAASLSLAAILWWLSERLALRFLGTADHALLFSLLALTMPLNAIGSISWNLLRAQRKPWLVVGLSLGNSLLTLLLTIVFVVLFRQGLRGVYLAMLCAAVPFFLVNIGILHPWIRWHRFSRVRLLQLLKYGTPLIPASMAYWIMGASDRFFLEHYAGLSDVGLYAVGGSIAALMGLMVSAFRQAWGPFANSIRLDPNCKEVYAATLTYYLVLTLGVAIGLSMFAPQILTVVATKAYYGAGPVVSYLTFAAIGYGAYYIAARGVGEVKKTAHIGWTTMLAAGVNIGLNVWLIPRLGIVGAGIAGLASQWVSAALLFCISQHYYPIPYRWRDVGILLSTSATIVAVGVQFHTDNIVATIALKALWLCLYPIVILVTGIVTPGQCRFWTRHLGWRARVALP